MTVENLFRLAVRLEESVKRTKAAIEKETDADQAQLYRDGVATMSKLRDEIMLEITGRVKGKA